MKDRGRILEKIQLVLNKATNNPSEAEAQLAILKAQELMAKYNVTQQELRAAGKDATEDVAVKKITFFDKKRQAYHVRLATVIADNFRCKILFTQYSIQIVGYESDAEATERVISFAFASLESTFKAFLAQDKRRHPEKYLGQGPAFSKYIKRCYIQGFIHGIKKAFEYKLQEDNSLALMVITPEAVAKRSDELTKKTVKLPTKQENLDVAAVKEGYVNGKKVLDEKALPEKEA